MKLGGFRRRTFVAVVAVSVIALGVGAALTLVALRAQLLRSIERTLVAETRLAAALLGERLPLAPALDLDQLADELGSLASARVTIIAPDGVVVGDSAEPAATLARLDNHGNRPEVRDALRHGIGVALRYSTTVHANLLYAAVPLHDSRVGVVRLGLPLTDIDEQVAAVQRSMLSALAVAVVCAVALAWLSSQLLSRRVDTIAAAARRYAAGDFSTPTGERGGDELGAVALALDDTVAELGRRMTELAQDQARMQAILGGMLEGVLVLNAQGQIQMVNEAAKRLLRDQDLAAGQHHLEVLRHPDVGAMLTAALADGQPGTLEFSPPRDPNRTIVARAAPVSTGGTTGVVLVLHDISDLRQADRMRRDFVANVSHELRTPLTAIRGYVEALLDDTPDGESETRRFLEIIDRQATRMERLVRDLLRLARLEAGQEPVDRVRCATESVFAGVVTELAATLEERQQTVETSVDPPAAELVTDQAKLHDVLRNLVENASAYAPPGTRIDLSARREAGHIVLTVGDEGPGIPEVDLARIFERFYRVDRARSRESGGTGLGLSIVKHLVSLLGGEVKAANKPTGGAIFTVRLPASA